MKQEFSNRDNERDKSAFIGDYKLSQFVNSRHDAELTLRGILKDDRLKILTFTLSQDKGEDGSTRALTALCLLKNGKKITVEVQTLLGAASLGQLISSVKLNDKIRVNRLIDYKESSVSELQERVVITLSDFSASKLEVPSLSHVYVLLISSGSSNLPFVTTYLFGNLVQEVEA